ILPNRPSVAVQFPLRRSLQARNTDPHRKTSPALHFMRRIALAIRAVTDRRRLGVKHFCADINPHLFDPPLRNPPDGVLPAVRHSSGWASRSLRNISIAQSAEMTITRNAPYIRVPKSAAILEVIPSHEVHRSQSRRYRRVSVAY